MVMLVIMTKSTKSAKTLQAEPPQSIVHFRGGLPVRQTEAATKISSAADAHGQTVHVEKSVSIN